MIQLPKIPKFIESLPLNERGYPVPWFVTWIDGKPEFRVADGRKRYLCVKDKLCWVCGQKLGPSSHVFVIGPMCAVNMTTAEPPCHRECAEFSAAACPFLSMPNAKRRECNLPEGSREPDGISIKRNPGVALLWHCRGYEIFSDGKGGSLFRIPNPSRVQWWAEGRKATREEILDSINSGLPILHKMADEEGPMSVSYLKKSVARAMSFVPAS